MSENLLTHQVQFQVLCQLTVSLDRYLALNGTNITRTSHQNLHCKWQFHMPCIGGNFRVSSLSVHLEYFQTENKIKNTAFLITAFLMTYFIRKWKTKSQHKNHASDISALASNALTDVV